jgi:hypothetical protein
VHCQSYLPPLTLAVMPKFLVSNKWSLNLDILRMESSIVEINFEPSEQRFLSWVFMEIFGGGSTRRIQKILGSCVEDARFLEPKIRLQCEAESALICLSAEEWRVMYESVNAIIYGLGPSELHTCTGYNLQEVCSINLKICAVLWEAHGVGRRWVGS